MLIKKTVVDFNFQRSVRVCHVEAWMEAWIVWECQFETSDGRVHGIPIDIVGLTCVDRGRALRRASSMT